MTLEGIFAFVGIMGIFLAYMALVFWSTARFAAQWGFRGIKKAMDDGIITKEQAQAILDSGKRVK